MSAAPNSDSSLNCELRIIRANNVDLHNKPSSKTNLFVRYYLSAGANRRIKLNSREISSKSRDMLWDESFSLECFGNNQDSIQMLMQETVVFELRYRNTRPLLFGGSSHLLGRVEVPWKTVLESPDMEIEQWFTMKDVAKSGQVHDNNKHLALQIGMKVKVQQDYRRKMKRTKKWDDHHDECGCRDHDVCKCCDANIFAIAALMETLN